MNLYSNFYTFRGLFSEVEEKLEINREESFNVKEEEVEENLPPPRKRAKQPIKGLIVQDYDDEDVSSEMEDIEEESLLVAEEERETKPDILIPMPLEQPPEQQQPVKGKLA